MSDDSNLTAMLKALPEPLGKWYEQAAVDALALRALEAATSLWAAERDRADSAAKEWAAATNEAVRLESALAAAQAERDEAEEWRRDAEAEVIRLALALKVAEAAMDKAVNGQVAAQADALRLREEMARIVAAHADAAYSHDAQRLDVFNFVAGIASRALAATDTGALLESLAALEHEQWTAWSQGIADSPELSASRLARWKKLWRPYGELTENEKEQDREWARRALAIFAGNARWR